MLRKAMPLIALVITAESVHAQASAVLSSQVASLSPQLLQPTGHPSPPVAGEKNGSLAHETTYGDDTLDPAGSATHDLGYALGTIRKQSTKKKATRNKPRHMK